MVLLYNIGIYLFYFFARIAAPFSAKARLWVTGRKNLLKHIAEEIKEGEKRVWFHAASLGEFEQGRPLMEAWRKEFPDTKIVLTFFSPSGYEIRKNYEGADYVFYFPLDTASNARKFIELVKPTHAIFIKYEFWYHFLNEAKKFGSRLVLVSAIFRKSQAFFKPYGKHYLKILQLFDQIFVQDEPSLRLLNSIDIFCVSIAGDTRFDRVEQIAQKAEPNPLAESFCDKRFCIVFGSTWEKDEELICRYINESSGNICFVIAPHEIDESHIKQLDARLNKQAARYSQHNEKTVKMHDVLIIDNIGLLSTLYRYGKVAYIGGGFGKGIHNILEPAVNGMPVLFGPKHEKFREALELKAEGGAFAISNYDDLKELLDSFIDKAKKLHAAGEATKQFVQRNLGATDVIMNFLKKS